MDRFRIFEFESFKTLFREFCISIYRTSIYIYIYKVIESLIIFELRIRFEREERRKCDETSFD